MVIYTDGSCKGNPGPGGWAAIVLTEDETQIVNIKVAFEDKTTNNRMEMKAIIWALKNYGLINPIVYSDSVYAINTFTNWMYGWKKNGWKRPKNKPVENLDLVQEYDSIKNSGSQIELHKISGHSGVKWNELADQLATGQIAAQEVLKQYGSN